MLKTNYINTQMLKDCIKKSGIRKAWLCERLDISYPAFHSKVAGERPFTAPEISALQKSLNLSDAETIRIFIREI